MTTWTMARPRPSPLRQWWVLTVRVIAPTVRNGELLIAITMSVGFTAGLYIPLNRIMATVVQVNYAQYLTPAIALQAVFFAAMSAALRSATDSVHGINRRFGAMPIPVMTPMAARMSGNVYRCVVALATAIVCGHVIGFRFYQGAENTVGFCVLVLLIGVVVAVLGDLIGMAAANPEATTHILLLPQITLMTLSVGSSLQSCTRDGSSHLFAISHFPSSYMRCALWQAIRAAQPPLRDCQSSGRHCCG